MGAITRAKRITREAIEVLSTNGTAPRSGAPLPPEQMRQGGRHFLDNSAFVESGLNEIDRLSAVADLDGAFILDLGCGPARLAIGLLEAETPIRQYTGLEVQRRQVRWGTRHLTRRDSRFIFVHVDTANERYSPDGTEDTPLPLHDDTADLFYAYSVFSHMRSSEVAHHLREAARVLRPGGTVAATVFIEDDVPDEVENPDGYGPFDWAGALHCVRFRTGFFEQLVHAAGLEVVRIDHRSDTDGQSFVVLGRR